MVSPTSPSAGTGGAFGCQISVGNLKRRKESDNRQKTQSGNYFEIEEQCGASFLLHIVCGGFDQLGCPRGGAFENHNCQIPTFTLVSCPDRLHHCYACMHSGDVIYPQLQCIGSGHKTTSVPTLGEVGETIDRCIRLNLSIPKTAILPQ